jgi:hypothetical protein
MEARARRFGATTVRRGRQAGRGVAWRGRARRGLAGLGSARQRRRGVAGPGRAWRGRARHGVARLDKAGEA